MDKYFLWVGDVQEPLGLDRRKKRIFFSPRLLAKILIYGYLYNKGANEEELSVSLITVINLINLN